MLATSRISPAIRKVLSGIPHYDPFRGAADFYFDEAEWEMRREFFETILTHQKGEFAGREFRLEPWQQSIIANLFGWKHRVTNMRRYREALIMVARKNGKTPLAAGIAASVFIQDDEPGMEVYSAAAEAEQAGLTWSTGKHMLLSNADTAAIITPYQRSLVRKDDPLSVWKYISSDAESKHGYNLHCGIVDELHVCSPELLEVLQTATGARRQPLLVYITTSDYERPSVCNRIYDYASKVRDGIIDNPRFLPAIYEAAPEDNWKSPKVWAKANPNLGVSKSLDSMQQECQKAQDDPSYENSFKRLHLNIRTNQETAAIQMDKWEKCGAGASRAQLAGRAGWAGLDLGATSDLTAFRMRFPNSDGTYDGFGIYWIPRARALEREKKDRIPYLTWANQGWIRLTDGDETDYEQVRADIMEVSRTHKIIQLAVDYKFQGAETSQYLEKNGIKRVDFQQSVSSYTAPTREYLRLINAKLLYHGGDPVLKWNASNLMLYEMTDGACKPSKDKSQNKIDAIVADIMAIGLSMAGKVSNRKSVYESRGALML